MAKLLSLYDSDFNLLKMLVLNHKKELEKQLSKTKDNNVKQEIEADINRAVFLLNRFSRE